MSTNTAPATSTIDPARRTAGPPPIHHDGPITLINSFSVPEGRDDAFHELWRQTSGFFRTQPGFVALRLHRALSPGAQFRYVNVAEWADPQLFQAAHATDEFRQLVSQPEWREFPSSPCIYEVTAVHSAVHSADDSAVHSADGGR